MDNARDRLRIWWAKEEPDRPLFVMHNAEKCPAPQQVFANVEEYWLDIPKKLNYEISRMEHKTFYGENYPGTSAMLGPGSLALYLNSKPGFTWDTVWYHPGYEDITTASVKLNTDSEYWRFTLDYTNLALAKSNGRFLVELPDFIENFDTLASLFGLEALLIALIDCPEEIKRLQDEVLAAWFEAYDTLFPLIKDEHGGMSVGGFNLWAPGRVAKLQCDNSVMISKDVFDEVVAPYFVKQAEKLDYVLYHLDGPNSLQHEETILNMNCIDAIQWQPGAAYPDAIDPMWYPLQKRILDTGKNIMIFIKPGDASTLLSRLEAFVKTMGKRSVMFVVEQDVDERLAYDILNRSHNWG